jgi:hypothetical protein
VNKSSESKSPAAPKLDATFQQKSPAQQAIYFDVFGTQVFEIAQQLRISTKPLESFLLAPAQREVLLSVPKLPNRLRSKLLTGATDFTLAEACRLIQAIAKNLAKENVQQQRALLMVATQLHDRIYEGLLALAPPPPPPPTKKPSPGQSKAKPCRLYQFKITLLRMEPPIWRRIQVPDCTLDKLHEHIQTAMGWTNSHLHEFKIHGERYADPDLLGDDFADFPCHDSRTTLLREILPRTKKHFAFTYEYDFGDSWRHEVVFESQLTSHPQKKYPRCVAGERACPPEDCGGVQGYGNFLVAIRDPQHPEHQAILNWHRGPFDPEKFHALAATRAMQKGLPDWRSWEGEF